MREAARPGLSCMLAISAALAAPACLARQATTPQPIDATEVQATALEHEDAADTTTERRSAFGRVMSIMIAALKDGAGQPDPRAATLDTAQGARTPTSTNPVHTIRVGAAFRLDQPTVAAESSNPPSPTSD